MSNEFLVSALSPISTELRTSLVDTIASVRTTLQGISQNRDRFYSILGLAFGDGFNTIVAESIRSQWLNGDFSPTTTNVSRALVVIDAGVDDHEFLIKGVLPDADVMVLDRHRNGIAQIDEVLRIEHFSALQIVAHGSDGELQLGNISLNLSNLLDYATTLQSWQVDEISLYACEVASGATGRDFVKQLAVVAGAKVAAATAKVGNSALGGSWNLAVQTGLVAMPLAIKNDVLANYTGLLAVTQRVSVATGGIEAGGGDSYALSISGDGRYVAFQSYATNLVTGDTNGIEDIFVYDRQTNTTQRISVGSNGTQSTGGDSYAPSISSDGRYVAFGSSSTNLVTGDTNGIEDIFVYDRQTNTSQPVSLPIGGRQDNHYSGSASISSDGRYVAFDSGASNLVTGDTNRTSDVFVYDRQTNTTQRVSVATDGTQANNYSYYPSISSDGQHVAFQSHASNLVTGDTNHLTDSFVRDTVANNQSPTDLSLNINTINENVAANTVIGNFSTTDPDTVINTFTYSLVTGTGSDDNASFTINGSQLQINASPDFETKSTYDIRVRTTDQGGLSLEKALTITITNVNEAPTVTSGATASFAENATETVYTITGTDPDAGTTFTYSISGTDAALFNINSSTGAVTFKTVPNFESPTDNGANNIYDINVIASDGSLSDTKAVAITVTNVNEAPTITSGASTNFAKNGTGIVYIVTASDPDAATIFTYSISGTDAALFSINNSTGAVTFKTAPNFESPTDNGANNVYDINVIASDGSLTDTKAVAITVTNINKAPTVTSGATANFAKNGIGTVYTVTATDPDAGTSLSYSISGTDAALFNINISTGAVTFKTAPNFEAPTDNDANNIYDINVIASDGSLTDTKAVAITVTNVNEAPTITAATFSIDENSVFNTLIGQVVANDPNTGDKITFGITSGNTDINGNGKTPFAIDSKTGEIKVNDPSDLNFEKSPTFNLGITATDAGGLSAQAVFTINLKNVFEPVTFGKGDSDVFTYGSLIFREGDQIVREGEYKSR